jgi:hypothetical protein
MFISAATAAAQGEESGLGQTRELSYFDASNRFLDKEWPAAKLVPSNTIIDGFENWDDTRTCWAFDDKLLSAEVVEEHATEGKRSLKVTFAQPANKQCRLRYAKAGYRDRDTSVKDLGAIGYRVSYSMRIVFNDEVRLDVFNPGPAVKLGIFMGKEFVVQLKPGANEISLKTTEMITDCERWTCVLENTAFYLVDPPSEKVVLYFDNFRWVGAGVGENLLKSGKLFHFGPDYYTRPYFSHVDNKMAYTKELGYGWEKPELAPRPYTSDMFTWYVYPTQSLPELLNSNVQQINSPFLVDLPDGRYRVHMLEGWISAMYSLRGSRYDLTIMANGKPALIRRGDTSVEGQVRACYSLDQVDYEPGEDKLRKYLQPDGCWPLEFDADVNGGQLKLEFLTEPLNKAQISFMIIYPVDKADAIEPELSALWKDLAHQFNERSYQFFSRKLGGEMHVPGLHEEYLAPEVAAKKAALLKPSDADRASGYMVFSRGPTDEVYPDSVPAPEECGGEFSSFGPAGEIQAFAPSLYALKALEDVSLKAAEFVGPDGAKITADRVETRVVNCMYRMSGEQSHGDWPYTVMPWYIVKRDKVRVLAGTSRRFWVSVDVPADAKPGKYVAKATISAKGVAPREVELRLEVLPFKLDAVGADVEYTTQPGELTYNSLFSYYYRTSVCCTPGKKAQWEAILEKYKEADRVGARAEFDLIKKYGFNTINWSYNNLVTPEFVAPLKLYDYLKLKQDEQPPEEAKLGWAFRPAIRISSMKRAYLYDLGAFTEDWVNKLSKEALNVSINGYRLQWAMNQEAGLCRFEDGFFMWRIGAKGCVHAPWRANEWGNPYHPFDGESGEFGNYANPGSGPWPTLNSTVVLEGVREGIMDYRYLITLERLVKEKAGTPTAAEGQKVLDALRETIVPKAKEYFQRVGHGGENAGVWSQIISLKPNAWKDADFRDARRKVADAIGKLVTPDGGK